MAEDSEIPPLEDMTEVLKQASTIRAGMLNTVTNDKPQVTTSTAKARAKVKKNVAAKVVNLENVNNDETAGDHKTKSTTTSAIPSQETSSSPSIKSPAVVNTSSGGSFGGMKKGFLFGGTPKSSSNSNTNKSVAESIKPVEKKEEKSEKKTEEEDIPFIAPKTGKTQSGLTINEVQQAMSEAKGLLDNQDWINDDLLNKVEKHDLLLKRFADPHFMKALQEFQVDPTAAMEKYKGNQEVEKFLTEFCGLLGDHFTNLGSASDNVAKLNTPSDTQSRQSKTASKVSEQSDKETKPKIIEIVDTKSESTEPNDIQVQNIEKTAKKCPKIIELTDNDKSLRSPHEQQALEINNPRADIKIHSSSEETDIQELSPSEDDKVKEMLNDPRVLEILMDPKIMNLIQLLKTDPEMAQRTVDTADVDLKDKIKFLVSSGLLQFQSC